MFLSSRSASSPVSSAYLSGILSTIFPTFALDSIRSCADAASVQSNTESTTGTSLPSANRGRANGENSRTSRAFSSRSRWRRVDPRRYNGASFLGLKGIVVKSHGSADDFAFLCAIERAAEEAREGMLHHISEHIEKWHHANQIKAAEVS